MLIDFFYLLKEQKIPVSLTEWMTLMEALSKGLHDDSLMGFYELCRTILIKDETYYDMFDNAFSHYFKGLELKTIDIHEDLMKWLEGEMLVERLPQEILDQLKDMSMDELIEELKKRLEEQTERHDGGTYWIGTKGASPFGNNGQVARNGIRIGGEGKFRSAIALAGMRRYKNYRNDQVLDVRQTKMALKKLRILAREGRLEELDLDQTIDKTCRNAGEIELIWEKSRKNIVKIILLMDTGGSMSPYASLCNRLFSAAYQSDHFKHFKTYFFHNHLEDYVYVNYWSGERIQIDDLFHKYDKEYRVIIVGDAAMAPDELYSHYFSQRSGYEWFMELKGHFPNSVWLNPDPVHYWDTCRTNMDLRKLFRMYPLTIDGLDKAIWALIDKKRR